MLFCFTKCYEQSGVYRCLRRVCGRPAGLLLGWLLGWLAGRKSVQKTPASVLRTTEWLSALLWPPEKQKVVCSFIDVALGELWTPAPEQKKML